ncbi:MAG TPA: double-strand break repair protein AddB, partial [Rhodobacteraceae bacterium]|nr:double-strand break repair protein AddB [Paracoccaceae bacterium]
QPDSLSVTGVTRLIRDPYAVYAEKILRIKPLDPLRQQPDAPIAGTVIHRILERFIKERTNLHGPQAKQQLMAITDEVLLSQAPWPAARRIWRAKVGRFADWFLEGEVLRSARTTDFLLEKRGEEKVGDLDILLIAKADRLDLQDDGTVCIYDYKTGTPPSNKRQLHFEKQLLLTAAMVELGGFKALGHAPVSRAEYIGLGAKQEIVPAPINQIPLKQVWAELETLLSSYLNGGKGYTSRRAMEKMHYDYGYDHLARFGEWDTSSEPMPEVLK